MTRNNSLPNRANLILPAITTTIALAVLPALPALSANYGLTDLNGKILLPPIYREIKWISPNCFRVTPDGNRKTVVPFFVNERGVKISAPAGVALYNEEIPVMTPPMVPTNERPTVKYPKLNEIKLRNAKMREDLGFGFYLFERGGFGICDQNGKIIIPPGVTGGETKPIWTDRFLKEAFNENTSRREYLLYDSKMKFLRKLPPGIMVRSSEFHDGLLMVETEDSGQYGYLNRDGDYQIKPRFSSVRDFNEGIASVQIQDRDTTCGALIDTAGKVVAGPFKNSWIETFENGVPKNAASTYK